MKKGIFLWAVVGVCCADSADQKVASYCIAQKFASTVSARIDNYVRLCTRLAQRGPVNIYSVNVLAFTSPSIIRCYNAIVRTGDVSAIAQLWQAYCIGVLRKDETFTYEFCHLLFIVLKHQAYQLLGEALLKQQGQLAASDVSATLPMDDLLNLIDLFYQRLTEFLAKQDQQEKEGNWHLPVSKRWVALGLVCLVLAQKIYLKWIAVTTQGGQTPRVFTAH